MLQRMKENQQPKNNSPTESNCFVLLNDFTNCTPQHIIFVASLYIQFFSARAFESNEKKEPKNKEKEEMKRIARVTEQQSLNSQSFQWRK